MEERLAIKRSDAWLWQSNISRAELLSRLEKSRVSRDWLVCPQGSSGRAVTVGQFVDDPALFQRQDEEAAAKEKHQRALIASVEKPPLLKVGKKLLQLFCAGLIIGGAILRIFFPHMIGAGLNRAWLTILVPIWLIGVVGLVASMVGWFQYRHEVRSTLKRELGPTNRSS